MKVSDLKGKLSILLLMVKNIDKIYKKRRLINEYKKNASIFNFTFHNYFQ